MAKTEDILEQYLAGKSDISKQYQKSEQPKIPKRIDDVVLSLAKFSVVTNEDENSNASFFQRWQIPLSVAAVFVISASLVMTLYDEYGQSYLDSPSPQTVDIDSASNNIFTKDDIVEIEDRTLEQENIQESELNSPSLELDTVESYDSDSSFQEPKLEAYSLEEKIEVKQEALPNKSVNQKQRLHENVINEFRLEEEPVTTGSNKIIEKPDLKAFELTDALDTDLLSKEKVKVLSSEIDELRRAKAELDKEQKTLQESLERNNSRQSELQKKLLDTSDLKDISRQSSIELKKINELWDQGSKEEAKRLLVDYLKNKSISLEQLRIYLPDELIKAVLKENRE